MRLSHFITEHLETILQEWEDFARTLHTPAPTLDASGLRNHAEHILKVVAVDLRTPQTEQQQIDKSQGRAPQSLHETAAQKHAVLRLMDGFTLEQMVAEYRALRSTVLRRWLTHGFTGYDQQLDDMIRFNEAIDQALVESIASYSQAVEITRKTVLGVLGHDLRSPLSAVLMGADLLRKNHGMGDREKKIAGQIAVSVRRANQMVNDLLDLARCNLGTGLPVKLELVELNAICRAAVEELDAGHPQANILFTDTAKVVGRFDPARIAQVFSNLIGNAVRHGDLQHPVQVTLGEQDKAVIFTVQNFGDPIPPDALPYLFDPQGRYSRFARKETGPAAGLGLGLFIAAEIVAGHQGEINARSSAERGTVFEVKLPLVLS